MFKSKDAHILHSIYVSVRQMCEHVGFTVGKEDDPNWCVSIFIYFCGLNRMYKIQNSIQFICFCLETDVYFSICFVYLQILKWKLFEVSQM